MESPPDWDLLAVVRSCNTTTTTTTTTAAILEPSPPPPPLPPPLPQQQEPCSFSPTSAFRFPNPFESPTTTTAATTSFQELQDICSPLICTTAAANTTSTSYVAAPTTSFQAAVMSTSSSESPFTIAGRSFAVAGEAPLRRPVKSSQVVFGAPNTTAASSTTSQAQRTKKRKNLMKKVCHVPAEGLSSDMWAWRKYGQKPIKGSPYPRGYYRCSSSKGCLARKQVERNRSDPKMFIVTYTAEHNHPMPTHRNSLAGSTRQKSSAATPPEQPSCSSPSAALSPATEKSESTKNDANDAINAMKDEIEDDNEMGISDLMLNDDFYVGFEQIDGGDGDGDCFSDHFSPPMELPWLSSNSGTATAAGGS